MGDLLMECEQRLAASIATQTAELAAVRSLLEAAGGQGAAPAPAQAEWLSSLGKRMVDAHAEALAFWRGVQARGGLGCGIRVEKQR